MQVRAISADDHCVRTHLLDAVHSMRQRPLMRVAASPVNDEQIRLVRLLRWITPAAAGAVDQIVSNETILKRVALRFRQSSITRRRDNLASIGERHDRNSQQRHVAGSQDRKSTRLN